jgi:heme/copper-type cytochrome/quinol oxidase subunit 3
MVKSLHPAQMLINAQGKIKKDLKELFSIRLPQCCCGSIKRAVLVTSSFACLIASHARARIVDEPFSSYHLLTEVLAAGNQLLSGASRIVSSSEQR